MKNNEFEEEFINDSELNELRNKLIDYYGSAMSFYKLSVIDLNKVYLMSDEEIIEEAIKLGLRETNFYQRRR